MGDWHWHIHTTIYKVDNWIRTYHVAQGTLRSTLWWPIWKKNLRKRGYMYMYNWFTFSSVQFSSVAQSCPTLCDPMNHSTPGLPVHRQLPEFTQTHIHQVSDAIQPSVIPFSSCPQSLPASESFPMSQLFAWVHSEGDQPWDFFGRNDAKVETPVLWPPRMLDVPNSSWLDALKCHLCNLFFFLSL